MSEAALALDYLNGTGDFVGLNRPDPCLIIVETSRPDETARAAIAQIRTARSKLRVPLVLLCDEAADEEIRQCYKCGANSLLVADDDPLIRQEAAKKLLDYWVRLNCATLTRA